MKKAIISIILLLPSIFVHSQAKQPDLQSRITSYLVSLDSNFMFNSTKHYLLQFSSSRKRKINNLYIYFIDKNNVVSKRSSNLNKLNFDSLYIITGTISKTKPKKLLLPYIVKNVEFISDPKFGKEFNSVDFDVMFSLLQFIQFKKDRLELLNPIIVFKEKSMH